MSYASQVKIMTSDPGARFLGGVADDLKEQLDALKAQVDACCGGEGGLAPRAPTGDAKEAAPANADAKVP
jgi:hypothetical protein